MKGRRQVPVARRRRSGWTRCPVSRAAVGALVVVLATRSVAAAQAASLVGTVVDGLTERPIAGALVEVVGADLRTVTNKDGTFSFDDMPAAGPFRIHVQHLSYQDEVIVTEAGHESAAVFIRLFPRPIELDSIGVRVERRIPYLDRVGFYERRERGWGRFLDPDWVITRNRGFARADLFVDYVKGQVPSMSCARPPVYLDGRRIMNESTLGRRGAENDLLREMSSHDVGAVEVFPNGYGVPQFALNDTTLVCGAVVMWSKQWTDPQDIPGIDVVLCTPAESEGAVTIEGYVRDHLTGVVLPAARVTLHAADGGEAAEVVSDRFGRYRFCDVQLTRETTALARYGSAIGQSERAAAGLGTSLELELSVSVTKPGQVTGRVLAGQTGGGLGGARVSLEGSDRAATTDSRGYFRVRDVIPGEYSVKIAHPRFRDATRQVTVRSGRVADIQVRLEP